MRRIQIKSSIFAVLIVVAVTFLFAAVYTQIFADRPEESDPFEQVIEVIVKEIEGLPDGYSHQGINRETGEKTNIGTIKAKDLSAAQERAKEIYQSKFPGYMIVIKGEAVAEPPAKKPKSDITVTKTNKGIVIKLPNRKFDFPPDAVCNDILNNLKRRKIAEGQINEIERQLQKLEICVKDDFQTSAVLIDCPVDNKCWNWFLFYEESGKQGGGFTSKLIEELSNYMRQNASAGWTDYIYLWNFYDSNNPGKPKLPSYGPNRNGVNYDFIDYTKTVLVVPIKEWIKVGGRNIGVGDFSKAISLKSADDFKKLNSILQSVKNTGSCKKEARGQEPPAKSNRPQKSDFKVGELYTDPILCQPCRDLESSLSSKYGKEWKDFVDIKVTSLQTFAGVPEGITGLPTLWDSDNKKSIAVGLSIENQITRAINNYQEAFRDWERQQRLK